MPTTTATPGTAPSGRPIAVNGPCSSSASAGSASMPTTSEVMVMPSWVPESWKDSSLSELTTVRGPSVAFGGGLLGVGPLDRDEAELGRHEEAVGEDQQERRPEEQQGDGHAAASICREGAAQVLQDDPSIAGGSHSSGSRGPLNTGWHSQWRRRDENASANRLIKTWARAAGWKAESQP